MLTINDIFIETTAPQLLKAFHSNKEYIVFDISVFNGGVSINVICTDDYLKYANVGEDGYSFILDNDYETNQLIEQALLARWELLQGFDLKVMLGKYCYYRLLAIHKNK